MPFSTPGPSSVLRLSFFSFCAGSETRLRFDGRESCSSRKNPEEDGTGATGSCGSRALLSLEALGEDFLFRFDTGLSPGDCGGFWFSVSLRRWDFRTGGPSSSVIAIGMLAALRSCGNNFFFCKWRKPTQIGLTYIFGELVRPIIDLLRG